MRSSATDWMHYGAAMAVQAPAPADRMQKDLACSYRSLPKRMKKRLQQHDDRAPDQQALKPATPISGQYPIDEQYPIVFRPIQMKPPWPAPRRPQAPASNLIGLDQLQYPYVAESHWNPDPSRFALSPPVHRAIVTAQHQFLPGQRDWGLMWRLSL